MPYFIAKDREGCKGGWAVVDEAGDILGCHGDKQSAIDQAVAVSIATDEPFEGERAAIGELVPGDYVQWIAGGEAYFGEVYQVDGDTAQVKIYDEENGIYVESVLLAVVPVADLTKITDLPTVEPDMEEDRAAPDALVIGDFVSWDSSGGRARGRIVRIVRDGEINIPNSSLTITGTEDDPAALILLFRETDDGYQATDTRVGHKFSTLTKIDDLRTVEDRDLPDNYRPALADDVPEGRACGNCFFYDESRVNADGDKAWCERWDEFVDGAYYCNAWQPDVEDRAINQEAPAYMRAAARRGLEYYEQGLAGDGVVDRTIAEAREMVLGTVSDDKWVRTAAWIARHLGDLDSPDADPSSDNYPSAGVVAHLLWGSGPSKRAAGRTQAFAESVVARIRAEQERDSMITDNRAKWAVVATAIVDRLEGRAKPKHEERVNVIDLEVRETGDGMTFEGYAAVFNSESEDLGGFREYIAPGAFKRSLQSRNEVKLLWNHDAGEPLASVRGGTLKLTEDARGLKVEARLANTSRGRDVAELIRSKTVDSMSFGFSVIKDTWNAEGNVRTLNAVRLFEISMVSFPAYQATAGTVSVRSSNTIDADQLADALFKLESGEELDPTAASLITEVVAKLTKTEEVQEVQGDILALKQKKLDLLLKGM